MFQKKIEESCFVNKKSVTCKLYLRLRHFGYWGYDNVMLIIWCLLLRFLLISTWLRIFNESRIFSIMKTRHGYRFTCQFPIKIFQLRRLSCWPFYDRFNTIGWDKIWVFFPRIIFFYHDHMFSEIHWNQNITLFLKLIHDVIP